MALPWVRLDSNIGSHDKVLNLLSDPSAKKWQAYASYLTSIAWAGGHGTDGKVPQTALVFVHGTTTTARLLCKYHLWTEVLTGWEIVNFAERQELNVVAEMKRTARSMSGKKAACVKWHGPECGCWREGASDA